MSILFDSISCLNFAIVYVFSIPDSFSSPATFAVGAKAIVLIPLSFSEPAIAVMATLFPLPALP